VEALAALGKAIRGGRPFDLAVLDLCMPEMHGIDLARRISADPRMAGTGLALLTSTPDVGHTEASAAGIAVTMTKPVHLSRLQAALQDVIGARRGPEPIAAATPASTGRGLVLVVEDGEINQIVATGMLEHLGYVVEVADDGLAGVEAVRRTTFDAVFMDVQMPRMDGYQATREIRRMEGDTRHTPIIAMTAGAIDGDRELCLAAGMDDYISKPINVAVVEQALARWVPVR
jgi:CheY-like chemotaxis protein